MRRLRKWLARPYPEIVLLVLLLLIVLKGAAGPRLDDIRRIQLLSQSNRFAFTNWELSALARKVAYGLLAPQRLMDDTESARFVLAYLDNVGTANRLEDSITQAFTDPEVTDPVQATQTQQAELQTLRGQLNQQSPIAEAVLGEQVMWALRQAGFGWLGQLFPPVSGTFTPLPQLLVISPRARIESLYQRPLLPDLTAADQEALEKGLEAELPEISAYVTRIGGLSAYPAMLQESSSLDWVTDVSAHEWTHHYLMAYPLGWEYDHAADTRTINETTASLMGTWAGEMVRAKFYAPLLAQSKPLPDPLTQTQSTASAPRFDFQAEMHRTRVNVDRLLGEGRITEAEWYLEAQRRYFVAQGYRLRRLNQAYFAFHGAYADQPGASGEDPVGPLVRQVWALSPTPHDFVRAVARLLNQADLETYLAQAP